MEPFPVGRASFGPSRPAADELWRRAVELIEDERADVAGRAVSPPVDVEHLRTVIGGYDFARPAPAEDVLGAVAELLRTATVHTTHPRYFGLFNPTPTPLGVVGETLAAAFNPQLAAWSHAPAAAEFEAHLLRFLGGRLGYPAEAVAGSFTSGGTEANHTAVLLALTRAWPRYGTGGLRALPGRPVMYASAESHLAWLKIAHATGLGRDAVRLVPTGPDLRLDVSRLAAMVAADRAGGDLPFLAVATAGTTAAGAVDPLHDLADLCRDQGLRLHVDAAYGGAAALSDRLRPALAGIERADSITVDAHKWLSVPMGAGAFLCTDAAGLAETFRVTTSYMPADVPDTVDPYTSGMQWSRRFIGLKLFLSLAVAGRTGYAEQLDHDAELADLLRARLAETGWEIVNDTPFPVVCFADPGDGTRAHHDALARTVVEGGRAWISPVELAGRPALRACVISHRTTSADVEELVRAVNDARG
ncbi:pyridoxal phosphate-dependent decarboxylase family protein [Actinomadura syzygii]|uniref:Aminotransferase class V-fold PLP-dependent enzyme n=1 Tax=Actinomadura syzygii TaxID=1427538 RepID=A0A5D0UKT8_9ACTN|nr:pyridoxal-dependent decarboxylase [Actinomadura syzygii]TYC18430.1 aminotransferase class V-fold PLP-dependent enzyme [Actinomadura syzygii]